MLARSVLLVAGIVLVASTAVGGASAGARVSAPLPTLSSLALSASDFRSGGSTLSQSTLSPNGAGDIRPPLQARFEVEHHAAARRRVAGDTRAGRGDAASSYAELYGLTQSAVGRKTLAHAFAGPFVKGLSSGGKTKVSSLKQTIIGRAVTLSSESLRVPITLKTNLGTFTLRDRVRTGRPRHLNGLPGCSGQSASFGVRRRPGDVVGPEARQSSLHGRLDGPSDDRRGRDSGQTPHSRRRNVDRSAEPVRLRMVALRRDRSRVPSDRRRDRPHVRADAHWTWARRSAQRHRRQQRRLPAGDIGRDGIVS